jgi:hypothetical protein
MILYTNGDSHTAAAEAVVSAGFARDDSRYFYIGDGPHPANLAVSWSKVLADATKTVLHCHAHSGCSNDRIIRTTQDFLTKFEHEKKNWLMVIQWSTWERQEWLIDGKYYQVGASGMDCVPESHSLAYKEFIANINWKRETRLAHDKVWALHEELKWHSIPHVFFNGNNCFDTVIHRKRWGTSYIDPYDPAMTYDSILKQAGYTTVRPDSWHYGADAHSYWAKYMLQYLTTNKLI